jgi:hypothetical protein
VKMHHLRIGRPSPAMVVALVALFVALGGGAYAATKLPKNSVGTIQVINGSLLAKDFRKGQVPKGPKGPAGPAGPAGAAGAAGPAGPAGVVGPARQVLAFSAPTGAAAGAKFRSATATCNATEKAIGGAVAWVYPSGDGTGASAQNSYVTSSQFAPSAEGTDNATGFEGAGVNADAVDLRLMTTAICVPKS